MNQKSFLSLVFLFFGLNLLAQNDTIRLSNNDVIIGDVEYLDKNVLTFSTAYSDSDFKIEWDKVLEITSGSSLIIAFSDGERVTGMLKSIKGKDRKVEVTYGGNSREVDLDQVIFLDPIGQKALSNLSVDLDIGLTLTKANNLRQLTTNINGTYLARKWNANGLFKTVLSRQDGASDVTRMDAEIGAQYFLPKDWFVSGNAIFLSNDEQLLDLRSTFRLGAGYYFIHSNSMYLAASGGMAFTNEVYSNDTPDRNSQEGFIGLSFQKYSIGDLSMFTQANFYPSFSEGGRYRVDLNGNLKYDLPLDFYIKMSITYNYDSKPTEGATDSDYVFTTSFGWEFN